MIYTITLNPAFDVHGYIKELKIDSENYIDLISKDTGGKGVNISAALDSAYVKNTALIILGNENAAEFKSLLKLNRTIFIETKGRIRENLTIHTDKKETRISYKGFKISDNIYDKIFNTISIRENDIVTFTGSIPDGITKKATIDFILKVKGLGAKLIIDSKSLLMDDLYLIKPWLIKPNEEEISAYFNTNVDNTSKAMEYALKIREKGIENVIISLGAKGAVMSSESGEFLLTPPRIKPVSTIGAGDSMIAGFIFGVVKGYSKKDSFKYGVAFGTAACLTEGTNPPLSEQIQDIYSKIK